MTDNGMISVWRVVAPPGYGALGDVVSVGLDPPNAPVQVSLQCSRWQQDTRMPCILTLMMDASLWGSSHPLGFLTSLGVTLLVQVRNTPNIVSITVGRC
jgi:hypothetical protein